ncbi:biliverdin-producing heme oxygenase [Micromonospora sp. WMMD1082]|uniref:biliverdin-producing heme oxygenase n=1 Tax=Micromonospora sp. WMMD1082 TaxID=3016104 RepID=UPI002416A2EC|nr:biliverdin-producing heme oxygenase [Micromonospora sp. WMMD1082]MDG4797992.1 biliverdin-producing heme oxygenase [Micromonospora sp. WMMD1082]
MGFAAQVRELTRADHRAAQSVTYFDALLAGRLDRAGYAALLEQLHVVYQTLEEAAEAMRDDPVAGPFVVDELRRLPRIAADLAFLCGPDWAARITPGPATQQYQARLREVAFTWPAGFVAHHYTRYLGDLSGGQVMVRALRRTFGFDSDGVGFFLFPGLDPRAFKQHYRDLLDTAPWDEVERQRFLDEVSWAYRLNTDMLDELGRAVVQGSAA